MSNNVASIQYAKGSSTSPTLSFDYVYDKTGNITKETSQGEVTQYVYDSNNQLKKEILSDNTSYEYQYDNVGNRIKTVLNGKITKYTYNDGNQIVMKNDSSKFIYDADGNLKQDDKFKYDYNEIGAQSRVTNLTNNEVAKYEYDEEGLRTRKIIGSKTYEYFYDGEDNNLSYEVLKENNQIKRYRYYQWDDSGKAVGMVIKEQDISGNWQSRTYYFWTNQRGDIIKIIDSSGAEVGSYTYDSYGNILSEIGNIAKEKSSALC